jgi:hypothetical protein
LAGIADDGDEALAGESSVRKALKKDFEQHGESSQFLERLTFLLTEAAIRPKSSFGTA